MKRIAVAWTAAALAIVAEAATPPAAELPRRAEFTRVQLSPDGKLVGMLATMRSGRRVLFYDVSAGKPTALDVDLRQELPAIISNLVPASRYDAAKDFFWVGPRRVVLEAGFTISDPALAYSGFSAVDVDGRNYIDLPDFGRSRGSIQGGAARGIPWDRHHIFVPAGDPLAIYVHAYPNSWDSPPDAMRIDTMRGSSRLLWKNPGTIAEWLFAPSGAALGVGEEAGEAKLFGRDGGAWKPIAGLGAPLTELRLHAYDATAQVVFASRRGAGGRFALHAFDLKTAAWGDPLLTHARYDVAATPPRPQRTGPADLILGTASPVVLGLGIATQGAVQHWLDPRGAALQRTLDAARPGRINRVISLDHAMTRAVFRSSSDNNPGVYSLVDLTTGKVTTLAARAKWLREKELARMFPVKFNARDGLELDAYVTRMEPAAGTLPLVLLLREAPWSREQWEFHPLAQFLSTRGYAVLQVNHRGCEGYGSDFARLGPPALGGAVQEDLVDAVRWAVENRIADPARMAVVGRLFGGCSALDLLAREPELFRCGAALDPVVDWRAIARAKDSSPYRAWFGDGRHALGVQPDDQRLAAISPATFSERIRTPLLLIENDDEARVPAGAVKAFAAALKKRGDAVELHTRRSSTRMPPGSAADELFAYERLETFLTRHLAAPLAAAHPNP